MSNKKELHVKDLIIKADNVIIERKKREPSGRDKRERSRDPWGDWFFPPRRVREEDNERKNKDQDKEEKNERRSFSWV